MLDLQGHGPQRARRWRMGGHAMTAELSTHPLHQRRCGCSSRASTAPACAAGSCATWLPAFWGWRTSSSLKSPRPTAPESNPSRMVSHTPGPAGPPRCGAGPSRDGFTGRVSAWSVVHRSIPASRQRSGRGTWSARRTSIRCRAAHAPCPSATAIPSGDPHGFRHLDGILAAPLTGTRMGTPCKAPDDAPIEHRPVKARHIFTPENASTRAK